MLKLSKTTPPQKVFPSDCITLYILGHEPGGYRGLLQKHQERKRRREQRKRERKQKCLIYVCNVYVTGEMDPSGESVSPGPNLTSEMEPGMNTDISERVSFDKFSSN